ncbi:MAG: gluconate 2-dehydrogenase alpha chain [Gaiellales bacterium]|jgi:gluconate 2-dehydrogenase alpha chain|nr:gluconate 2-dehydrogenase alpha chain [Gaiellales bacterium]
MATRLKEADVVVVGLGAAGGTAVWPLAQAGMNVVGLEAGPRVNVKDYPFDEIRNDIRDWMGRFKANREVPTTRLDSSQQATRPLGATGPMMNAVGGTSIHWMTQSWRYLPWNFKTLSETIKRYGASAIPAGSTVADWPFDYHDLEPWYDKVEYRHGVSGQAGNVKGKINHKGNIFEGPRSRGYALPPLRRSGWNKLTHDAAKQIGARPYPGPTGIRSRAYHGFAGCTYCGFCGWTGCWTGAKASTNLHFIPQAEKTGHLKVVTMARVTEVNVDGNGKATGVTYLKGNTTFFQPAKVVMLAGYMYENVRLMLLSKSKAYPNGLSNNHGQVGKHYMGHGLASASVMGVFPGRRLNLYSGTIGQYTAIDDWDADNFDHTGMGFIAGGMASATMESKPIGTANTTPPGVPRWGSGYKSWLAANADSVGTLAAQMETLSYEDNYVDLDPVVKDDLGRPVLRITFNLKDNEIKSSLWMQQRLKDWMTATGGQSIWTYPPAPYSPNTHAFGGARAGHDPATSVVDRWQISHETPNLVVLGGAVFPTSTGRNPTETIQATSWRAADHVAKHFKSLVA